MVSVSEAFIRLLFIRKATLDADDDSVSLLNCRLTRLTMKNYR